MSKNEKVAIILNVVAFTIIVVSTIIRILNDCKVINFGNSVAYVVVDIILLSVAAISLIFAFIFEKKVKKEQEQSNKKDD